MGGDCRACHGAEGCHVEEGCLPGLSKPACESRGGIFCHMLPRTPYPQAQNHSRPLRPLHLHSQATKTGGRLRRCASHCKYDAQCEANLRCFIRDQANPHAPVPGCTGRGNPGENYCIAQIQAVWKPEAFEDKRICRKLIRCKHLTFGSFGASAKEIHMDPTDGYDPNPFGSNYGGMAPIASLLETREEWKPQWMNYMNYVWSDKSPVQKSTTYSQLVSEHHCMRWMLNRRANFRGRHETEMVSCALTGTDRKALWYFSATGGEIVFDKTVGFLKTRSVVAGRTQCLDWGTLTGGRAYMMSCRKMWP